MIKEINDKKYVDIDDLYNLISELDDNLEYSEEKLEELTETCDEYYKDLLKYDPMY